MGELPEDAGFTPPLFSDAQIDAIVDFITAHGRARARAQGSLFNEVDFLAGAMTWFFALKMNGKIPAVWVFAPMRDESALDVTVPDGHVYVVMAGKLRQPQAIYKNRREAQEHVEQLWREGDEDAHIAGELVRQAVVPRVQERIDRYFDEEEQSLDR